MIMSASEVMSALAEHAKTLGWEIVDRDWKDHDEDGTQEYTVWTAVEAPEHRLCRQRAGNERVPAVFIGGPFNGRRHPGNGPFPPSPHRCAKPTGGDWHHYVHKGHGVYEHAGLCTGHHDPDDHPARPCWEPGR